MFMSQKGYVLSLQNLKIDQFVWKYVLVDLFRARELENNDMALNTDSKVLTKSFDSLNVLLGVFIRLPNKGALETLFWKKLSIFR